LNEGKIDTPIDRDAGYFSVVLYDKVYRANLLVCNVHMPKVRGVKKGRKKLAEYLEEATGGVDATVILGDFNANNRTLRAHEALGPVLASYKNAFDDKGIEYVYASDHLDLSACLRSPSPFTHRTIRTAVAGDAGPYALLRGVQEDLFN